MHRSKQLRCSKDSFAILRIALLRAAPQYCLRNFFGVSPLLQPRISCAGILSITFADTTSDRSALRTEGLALSGLPMKGPLVGAAFFRFDAGRG
jgi:hypothetical protein